MQVIHGISPSQHKPEQTCISLLRYYSTLVEMQSRQACTDFVQNLAEALQK